VNLLTELKRRNVIRMAGLYLIGAWLITQVSATLLPTFDAPQWVLRAIVMLLAIGFVPALIFSWVFELTPEGLKRDAEVKREESIAPQTARRMDRMIIVVLILALAYFAVDKFVLAPQRDAQRGATPAAPLAADKAGAATPAPGGTSAPAGAAGIPGKSIAVLPFENLSDEKANAYFATGMQDEILTRLAGIRDLKVISRTSTEQYASHPPNLKIVAEQLGVATLLEGSVQRADGRVRINLQLIDARSDSHLWAQNYDRDLKDVFAVQSDVSEKVADALKAQLLPAESTRIARVPTNNPEAYDRFLRAEYFARQFESTSVKNPLETERKAAELYASAIEADPMFALAYAQLAYVKGYAFWRGEDRDPQALEAAREGAQKALALQPDLAEAHLAMGAVHYWSHRDYAAALTEFATARASLPNDARVLAAIAFAHRRQGKLLKAVAELEQAAVLDPRDSGQPRDLADTFIYLRRYTEAAAASNRSLALAPDNVQSYVYRAAALQMRGDPEGANRSLAGLSADYDSEGSISLRRFNLALWMGQPDAVLLAIENAPPWLLDVVNNVPIPVTMLRGQALAAKGESGPARTAFLEAQESLRMQPYESRGPGVQINLAAVYAGLGQNDAALEAARRSTELMPVSQDMLDGPFYLARLARIEAKVGEIGLAMDHIEQLLALPAGYEISAASLRLDPAWAPLRGDARFRQLLAVAEKAEAANP
jgi:TolB-like protein/Flp pilus assembly protein TadD